MRRRWHTLDGVGDEFFEVAPFRYVNAVEVAVQPDQTWAALTADDALVSWSPLVTKVRWTSPRPFGVGTTREVTLLGLLTAREQYYRWEEGRRKTFTAAEVTVPGLRRLAEDFMVLGTPTGSRLVWTIVLEPHPALKPVLRLADPITAWILRSVARGLQSRVG
jgi:Polyketide cyclase / dehydrase and lipid transport